MNLYYRFIIIISIVIVFYVLFAFFPINLNNFYRTLLHNIVLRINTFVRKNEENLRKKLRRNELSPLQYKYNLFLERLKQNLEAFRGLPLIHFKFILVVTSIFFSFLFSFLLFNNLILMLFLLPITFITLVSFLYSITIKQSYHRIIDSITVENMLAPNISKGFLLDVKENLNSIPISLRREYENYIINVEQLNYHSEDALEILDLNTGKYSTEFLQDVNIVTNHTVEGYINKFQDIVEENGLKIIARNRMEKVIQYLSVDFTLSFIISFGFLLLELILMPALRHFYFTNSIGQMIFILDILLAAIMYMFVNLLKATEL